MLQRAQAHLTVKMMKISALIIAAVIAIANVSAADQHALRSAATQTKEAPGEATNPHGDKKEHFWGGGPWGGLGWGGLGWGGPGWGRGWGW